MINHARPFLKIWIPFFFAVILVIENSNAGDRGIPPGFVSSSGQAFFKPDRIVEPATNEEIKALLGEAYEKMLLQDPFFSPFVVGAGGYVRNGVKQGVSFGEHAYGKPGQPLLSTARLKKLELLPDDYSLSRDGVLSLKVKSGNTLGEVLALANSTLDKETQGQYEFFMTGPSSHYITVGGALAANTHFRSTYPAGLYFSDQVENFSFISIQNGKSTEIFCSREQNSDLFYAIPASFGRGGVITDVTLQLTLIPKNHRVKTSVWKIRERDHFLKRFQDHISQIPHDLNSFNKNFLGVNAIMTDHYYYIFKYDFVPESDWKNASKFDYFDEPGTKTLLAHSVGHAFPSWGNFILDHFLLGPNTNQVDFQNRAIPWLFFHDGFLYFEEFFNSYKKNAFYPKQIASTLFGRRWGEKIFGKDNMETAHQIYLMKNSDFPQFMKDFAELSQSKKFEGMQFKFRDFVPLPATRVIMSPSYSENQQDIYLAATLSWPVHTKEDQEMIQEFKNTLSELKYLKLHPLKEFDSNSEILRRTYFVQAERLHQILKVHQIDDRVIRNNLQRVLY